MQVVITEPGSVSVHRVIAIQLFPGVTASALFPGSAVSAELLFPVVDELIGNKIQVVIIRIQLILGPLR